MTRVAWFAATGGGSMKIVSGKTTITTTTSIAIQVGDLPYEAILGPGATDDKKMQDHYEAWIPEGQTYDGYSHGVRYTGDEKNHDGQKLSVIAYLRDKNTQQPIQGLRYHVIFKLESSKQPGFAMNFPKKADADVDANKPDLVFDKAHNAPEKGTVRPDDERGTEFETKDSESAAFATITSWDYGGYAKLTAQIYVAGSTSPIDAMYVGAGTSRPVMMIPLDENFFPNPAELRKFTDSTAYPRSANSWCSGFGPQESRPHGPPCTASLPPTGAPSTGSPVARPASDRRFPAVRRTG